MGISYNPSSFDTNKTILQAIEEIKAYLKRNPLACIYQCHGSVSYDLTSMTISNIVVPTGEELKAGDIVVAMNGYFNFIDSVGDSDVYFNDYWCNLSLDVQSITLNMDSTNTEIVDTPANFTNWIYRRVPRSNDRYLRGRTYYLVIQYKDSTAFPTTQSSSIEIPANYINAIWYQLNVDNSTTIYFDFTEDPDQQIYQLTNFTIPAGQDGTNGTDGVSITGATIDASNHLILTLSDGNTIDAGALPVASGFSNYVEINTTSGTFTDDEFAKLQFNDSVIVYDNGTYKTIYKKKIDTSSIIEFESIDASSRQNLKLIDVNKGTKAFSSTGISMITSSTFDSGNATSGKVLTANGSGGTSWETAGGGSQLYEHNICLYAGGTPKTVYITIKYIDTTSTTVQSLYELGQRLNSLGYNGPNNINAKLCQCSGAKVDNSVFVRAYIGVFYSSTYSDVCFCVVDTTNNVSYITSSTDSLGNILDFVRTL